MMALPWLSILTALPAIFAVVILLLPSGDAKRIQRVALVFSCFLQIITLILLFGFNRNEGGIQFQELHSWADAIGLQYHLGIDGIGLVMLLLSAMVFLIGTVASWNIQQRAPVYFSLVFFLQSCLVGSFTALNLFHWFIFWELSLVPAFFLIRLWGGTGRTSASIQFLVYSLIGSIAMLVSLVAIFVVTQKSDFIELANYAHSANILHVVTTATHWKLLSPAALSLLIFAGVFVGLAVKVPLVPFHGWLPAAYTESPTGTTILLTGAMSKMGLYGFLRILLPLFVPEIKLLLTPLLWLAVITTILPAYVAIVQRDLKRTFAYSSINHLGYCFLAMLAVVKAVPGKHLTAQYAALSGVLLQIFNHALTAAVIFLLIAWLEKRSGGERDIDNFGGLRKHMPVFTGLMGIALFSSLGLPGLNGFVAEFMIFSGSFVSAPWETAFASFGLLLTAIFILNVLQRVFYGPTNERWNGMRDLTVSERWILAPAVGLMFILGIYPQLLLGMTNSTVIRFVQEIRF